MEERFPHLKSQAEIDAEERRLPPGWWIPVFAGFGFGLWLCALAAILLRWLA